tara:strand:- start:1163 stop:1462 length:300 start_codon:yes stop_codon:yes gene_type:complete
MGFFKVLKKRKILFINIFLLLYISINLFMGERGLISYYEKKSLLNDLNEEKTLLTKNITDIERKNNLLSEKLDFDFVDTLIRQSFKFGNKEDILININD